MVLRLIFTNKPSPIWVVIPALQIVQACFSWIQLVTLMESTPIASVKNNYITTGLVLTVGKAKGRDLKLYMIRITEGSMLPVIFFAGVLGFP
jgi:hypothetical protein